MAKNADSSFLSDEELVHRYRNSHDSVYIGELYLRYTHLVYGVCLKYLQNDADAQDAVMQVFEKLIQELKRHHIDAFRPWLYTVVRNHCMMHFRREAGTAKNLAELKNNSLKAVENAADDHPDTEEEKALLVLHLSSGLDSLKEEQRTCVEMFYLRNLSYRQIADETGFEMNEVKSYIQNGKRNLKNYISEKSHGKT